MSSYKGKFGYVQYYVKAMMERPQQPTMECKKAFEVEEPLDVNTPDLLVSYLTLNHNSDVYMGFIIMSLTLRLTFLHLLSPPQEAARRRRSPACSSLTARCL